MQRVTIAAEGLAVCTRKQVSHTTPTLIESVTSDRKSVTIQNLGPNAIWIGFSSAITNASASFKIAVGDPPLSLDLGNGTKVYAIADTADQVSPADTSVIETR
jgi:hypothetical protein